jgi:AcrR family transcriptional regulator
VSAERLPVSARGQRTRAALLRAARAVFERDGFLDVKITDIAREAGVAVGSFYTYFDDKDEIFAAVLEEVEEEMLHPGVHLAHAAGDDPVAMIEDSNRAYLESYRDNAKLMRLLEQVAAIDEDFRELRRRRADAFWKRNARAIRRLQAAGRADPELDPDLTSLALSSMVSRLAYSVFAVGFRDVDLEDLVATVTRLWVNALRIR